MGYMTDADLLAFQNIALPIGPGHGMPEGMVRVPTTAKHNWPSSISSGFALLPRSRRWALVYFPFRDDSLRLPSLSLFDHRTNVYIPTRSFAREGSSGRVRTRGRWPSLMGLPREGVVFGSSTSPAHQLTVPCPPRRSLRSRWRGRGASA
jgi:hypothetical protein